MNDPEVIPTGCSDPEHPGGAFCTETTGLPYCTHYGDDPGKVFVARDELLHPGDEGYPYEEVTR